MTSTSGQSADLDSTIAALKRGLTAVPPQVAIASIESWQQQLAGTEVANLLGDLKLALSGSGSGKSAGALLSELGAQATSAANSTSGAEAAKLKELGQLLAQVSSSLP